MKKCYVPNPGIVIDRRAAANPGPYLQLIYQKLSARFGHQQWWPAKTPFEVIVGAILTQNTNWKNVEKAIANLRRARKLSAYAINKISLTKLAELIRPAGFYQLKSRRLKNFMDFFFREYEGKIKRMAEEPLQTLRPKLLSVNGIGQETADCILLYALGKASFVVDNYTKRTLERHGLTKGEFHYEQIRKMFMEYFPGDPVLFNEYHALIVRLGKDYCRSQALCETCPINDVNFSRDFKPLRTGGKSQCAAGDNLGFLR